MSIQSILVPGGLGYVGSHTILQIYAETDLKIVIVDDLSNCEQNVLERIKTILINQQHDLEQINKRIEFYKGNVLDLQFLFYVFQQQINKSTPISTVIHFAAKKCVPQSTKIPILYYENNLVGSLNIFKCMEKYPQCTKFIFSSTATIYGEKNGCEQTDLFNPLHPYAETKVCVEMLMKSLANAHKQWKVITLRYFNPCSNHPSGLIGDEPSVFPNNLFPFIQQVIMGNRPKLYIYGNDYNTPDGTGVRDYLHITDLASGHLRAIKKMQTMENNYEVYNLGTGVGLSVYDIIRGFEKALGHELPKQLSQRRPGDVSILVAKSEKAASELGWKVTKTLDDMCTDCLKFIEVNKQRLISNNKEPQRH